MQTFRQFTAAPALTEVRIQGQTIDATKFEADLVAALTPTSTTGYQNPVAEHLAKAVAESLRQSGVTGTAARNSGGGKKSNLTPLYLDYGVTSGEPKTDILVGARRYSMKYGPDAQIAAAQANEAKAVFAAAFADTPTYARLVEQQIVPLLTAVMTPTAFYKIRKTFNPKDLAEFGNQLSRFLHLHSRETGPMEFYELDAFRDFLQSIGVAVDIDAALTTFLARAETKRTLFHEFVTGTKRFINPMHSPTHMLAWYDDGRISQADVATFVRTHLSQFDYSFRDRGDGRGAAFRLAISQKLRAALAEARPAPAPPQVPVLRLTTEELDAWLDQQTAALRQILVQEGVFGAIGSAVDRTLHHVWEGLLAAVKMVIVWLVRLAKRGLTALLGVVGLEPARIAPVTWRLTPGAPPSDPTWEWA